MSTCSVALISSVIVVLVVVVALVAVVVVSSKTRCIFYMWKQRITGFVAMSRASSDGGIGSYFCGKH